MSDRDTADSPAISHLYRATFLFGLGCGISLALTALFLSAHGYTKRDIGSLAAFFASGIVVMALPAGALIRRFSGKRVLLTAMAVYAGCVAAFPFCHGYFQVAGVRFLDGACSAGIWVSSETILLSNASKERKAHLTSIYAICLATGYAIGAVLAQGLTHAFGMASGFVVSGVFAILAAAYIFLRIPQDKPGDLADEKDESGQPPSPYLSILARTKNSCFATFVYGYFQASVVLFLPLFLIASKGIAEERTIVLPGIFSFGMLLCSNAAGRLGDRIGHLFVMRLLSISGTLMILGFVFLDSYWLMCGAVFVAGATLAAMSPVSLALQGVVTEKRNYSRANAIYNAFYAAGMLIGPPLSSLIFERKGGAAMLLHLAAMWVCFIVFTIVFYRDDPAATRKRTATPVETPS